MLHKDLVLYGRKYAMEEAYAINVNHDDYFDIELKIAIIMIISMLCYPNP